MNADQESEGSPRAVDYETLMRQAADTNPADLTTHTIDRLGLDADSVESVEILDVRREADFKVCTFSGFKRTEVKNEFLKSLLLAKVEPACHWCAELVCSGHFADVWEVIILFFSRYVHLSNAIIAPYLHMRLRDFLEIVQNGYSSQLLYLRNNAKIRRLFAEIACILCEVKQRHRFDNVKINNDDLNIITIKDRFLAPSAEYAEAFFLDEDPKELFPFMNELAYSVSEDGCDIITACYWIEWIFEFESRCKSHKDKLTCERRMYNYARVDSKCQKDIVWMIWNCFLAEAELRENAEILLKFIRGIMGLFAFKYAAGCHKRRKFSLYFAAYLLCEPCTFEREILPRSKRPIIGAIVDNIHKIYEPMKQNEVYGNMEYLIGNSMSVSTISSVPAAM